MLKLWQAEEEEGKQEAGRLLVEPDGLMVMVPGEWDAEGQQHKKSSFSIVSLEGCGLESLGNLRKRAQEPGREGKGFYLQVRSSTPAQVGGDRKLLPPDTSPAASWAG